MDRIGVETERVKAQSREIRVEVTPTNVSAPWVRRTVPQQFTSHLKKPAAPKRSCQRNLAIKKSPLSQVLGGVQGSPGRKKAGASR